MKLLHMKYYANLDTYIPEHLTLPLLEDFYGAGNLYISTENKNEYRTILKLKRITNYGLYQMIKNDKMLRNYSWNKI